MIKNAKSKVAETRVFNFGKNLTTHPFFAGSAVMVIGSNISNFIAYIYHLIIGRLLGPAPYGELVAFLSVVGLVTVSFNFMGLVIVKYSASLEKEEGYSFFKWLNRKAFYVGIICAGLLVFLTPLIADFLHLENKIVIFLSPLFVVYLMNFVYRAFLQGKLRFKEVVISTIIDMGGRLLFGAALVLLGLSVIGAVFGNVISALASFLLLYFVIRKYLRSKQKVAFTKKRELFKYSVPVFFAAFSGYLLITSDVLMVKHYFPAHEAGLYAAISTLGKVVFYGTGPINAVMFPLVSKRHSKGHGYKKIIWFSLLLTFVMGAGITFIYYLFPELMISILYGSEFISAAPELYLMGTFLSIYALASLLLNYFISIEKTSVVYFAVAAAVFHLVGLYLFHENIIQVINISIIAVSLLLGVLLLYLVYDQKK